MIEKVRLQNYMGMRDVEIDLAPFTNGVVSAERIALVCEGPDDFRRVTTLFDHLLVREVDWIETSVLDSFRTWDPGRRHSLLGSAHEVAICVHVVSEIATTSVKGEHGSRVDLDPGRSALVKPG